MEFQCLQCGNEIITTVALLIVYIVKETSPEVLQRLCESLDRSAVPILFDLQILRTRLKKPDNSKC